MPIITTLSTLRTTAIVLGTEGYGSDLTITSSGTVTTTDVGTGAGVSAIEAPAGLGTATIDTSGSVSGASGGGGVAGVAGRDGGQGIHLAAVGVLGNAGTIAGGAGQAGRTTGGNGGDGVGFDAGGTLDNSGAITGGDGGAAYYTAVAGYSGGGAGVRFSAAGTVTNTGVIGGGKGANNHITFLILPHTYSPGGVGGTGIVMAAGGSLTNAGGTIRGGDGGGHGAFYYGGAGGAGADLAGVSLTNSGLIQGGDGGGAALYLAGGDGGAGVTLDGGGLVNDGTLLGGNGGLSEFGTYAAVPGNNARGGDGLVLRGGATATNAGLIQGGDGGTVTKSQGADGGDGVLVDGGTLVATATSVITGGAGSPGPFHVVQWPDGQMGAAVRFTALGGTLVLEPGASFNGAVIGAGAGTLELAGSGAGTLADYGGTIGGFAALRFDAGSDWSVSGTVAALAGGLPITGMDAGDTITLAGFQTGTQAFVPGTGLVLSDGGAPVTLDLAGDLTGLWAQATTLGLDTVVALVAQVATIDTFVIGPAVIAGGGGTYASALTIVTSGTIAAFDNGVTALLATVADADILNQGSIESAGIGVDLQVGGRITNEGSITGGDGDVGQAGWTGVRLADATLHNIGMIAGGDGAYGAYYGAEGGTGVEASGTSMLYNYGILAGGYGADAAPGDTIAHAGGVAVVLGTGASLTNQGLIAGGGGGYGDNGALGASGGVGVAIGAASMLTNLGVIYGGWAAGGEGGGGIGGTGVSVATGGSMVNGGGILGGYGGRSAFAGAGTGGTGGTGLELAAGATAVSYGAIGGGSGGPGLTLGGTGGLGVRVAAGATFVNYGYVVGGYGGYGVVTPGQGGAGIYLDGGRVENHQTIAGGYGNGYSTPFGADGPAVRFGALPGVLAIDAQAVFLGDVLANPAVDDRLELMDTAGPGTLDGLGTLFSGFTHVDLGAGASWVIGTFAGPVGFTLAGQSLELDGGALDGGTSFDFSAPAGSTLLLDGLSGAGFANAVTGFSAGDLIVAPGLGFAPGYATAYDGGAHTLDVLNGGSIVFTFSNFAINPGYVAPIFTVGADSVSVACYRQGTRIATPAGEVAIEALRIGDLVSTSAGPRPVMWLARRAYGAAQVAADRSLRPVLIAAGALGGGLPRRELAVSPRHGMLLDGRLVPAAALLGEAGIARGPADAAVTYFHVELERHGILFAEGAPSESYQEVESRFMFDNAAEFVRLHGAFSRRVPACAPRAEEWREPPAPPGQADARLLGHVERLDGLLLEGWTLDPRAPEAAVELEVRCDGMPIGRVFANRYRGDLDRAGLGEGRCGFSFEVPAPMAKLAWIEVWPVGGTAALPVAA